ncbi:hypothetical protein F5884DRAFT_900835 [Xylogone sp. PMI_703]|nr:hypothetical protein F5884DRAFT_900835 [Xylogone sp. PMI_703]
MASIWPIAIKSLELTTHHQWWLYYCPDDSNCNHLPAGTDECFVGEHNFHWEGGTHSCTFPSSTTFSWGIAADAQSHATFTAVGGGNNGFKQFTCYKDDGHGMFTQNGVTCKSVYYCI